MYEVAYKYSGNFSKQINFGVKLNFHSIYLTCHENTYTCQTDHLGIAKVHCVSRTQLLDIIVINSLMPYISYLSNVCEKNPANVCRIVIR